MGSPVAAVLRVSWKRRLVWCYCSLTQQSQHRQQRVGQTVSTTRAVPDQDTLALHNREPQLPCTGGALCPSTLACT